MYHHSALYLIPAVTIGEESREGNNLLSSSACERRDAAVLLGPYAISATT